MSILDEIKAAISTRVNLASTANRVEVETPILAALRPERDNLETLDWLARWIDVDERCLQLVTDLVTAFDSKIDGPLHEAESAHFEVARGLVAFHLERYRVAIGHFDYAQRLTDHLGDVDLRMFTRYSLARCYWKVGDYTTALDFVQQSMALNPAPALSGLIEMVEAWLFFLMDDVERAEQIFNRIEPIFEASDDSINKANLLSARGRIARHRGNLVEALTLLEQADVEYRRWPRTHRNVARTLSQIAFIKRLQALESSNGTRLREHAHQALDIAEQVYRSPQPHARGLGTIYNIRALLKADEERWTDAWKDVVKAYGYGRSRKDHVVMANARVIQSLISSHSTGRHRFAQARWYAEDAASHAFNTGNLRLQLRAQIWKSRAAVHLGDPLTAHNEWVEAQRIRQKASGLSDSDYLARELDELAEEIREAGHDGVLMTITPLNVSGRRLKDILEEVKVRVVMATYRECEDVAAVTRRRLGCDLRWVHDAVSRDVDDKNDKRDVATEIDKARRQPPHAHRQHTALEIGEAAAAVIRGLADTAVLDDALAKLIKRPIPPSAESISFPNRKIYRWRIPPDTVAQLALVYELIRPSTEVQHKGDVDPFGPFERVVLWIVRRL